MSNATPSRVGQIQGAGAVDALFLTQFAGEVISAFQTKTIMGDKVEMRSISSGQSSQFPAIWRANADYHVPGAEILGQEIEHNEITIVVDGILKSDAFVAEIDELKNHYEVRSHYSRELGYALARQYDANITRSVLQASGQPSLFSADQGGGSLTTAAYANDGAALAAGIYDGLEVFEGKEVPTEDINALFLPAQYYLLMQTPEVMNKDFGSGRDYSTQAAPKVGGVKIIRSNNTPLGTNETGVAAVLDKYEGDWTNHVGVMFHRSAAGVVKLKDVTTEITRDPRRLGTLMVSSMAVGHGTLRSKSALGMKTA